MGTINISLPDEMISKIDEILRNENYASRSELVRDSLRGFFSEVGWTSRMDSLALAVITMTFNIERRGTLDEVGRVEHRYDYLILTSLHNHMGNTCLEVLLTKGSASKIKELINGLKGIRGVETVRPHVV